MLVVGLGSAGALEVTYVSNTAMKKFTCRIRYTHRILRTWSWGGLRLRVWFSLGRRSRYWEQIYQPGIRFSQRRCEFLGDEGGFRGR